MSEMNITEVALDLGENFNYYDGMRPDILTIVLASIALALLCAMCIFQGVCKAESLGILRYGTAKYSCYAVCLLLFSIGINLLVRFFTDQCNFDPDMKCSQAGLSS